MPSGLFLSWIEVPLGSNLEVISADPSASLISLLIWSWRAKRPILFWQLRPWVPDSSTLLPQWQRWVCQRGEPSRRLCGYWSHLITIPDLQLVLHSANQKNVAMALNLALSAFDTAEEKRSSYFFYWFWAVRAVVFFFFSILLIFRTFEGYLFINTLMDETNTQN